MYFSRIRRPISSALSEGNLPIQAGNIYEEHKFIWGLFPFDKEAERDFLYRRLDAEGFQQFFVVSNRKPLESLNSWEIAIKSYKPKIVIGTQLHFNLRVNPVVTKMPEGPGSKKRKREDVYMDALAKNKTVPEAERSTNAEILQACAFQWLSERSEQNGFAVSKGSVIVEGYQRFEITTKKDTNKITMGVIDYSGILTVTDSGLFNRTLCQGLGKSKSFGCGLMMIKKV